MPHTPRQYDSFWGAYEDRRDHLESKGYTYEGYSLRGEPIREVDEEPLETPFPPGACRVGELGDYDSSDCEEF